MRIDLNKKKLAIHARRKRRIRGKISGTKQRPRLSVFRSSKHIALQIVDDETGRTLVSMASGTAKKDKATKTEQARLTAKKLAQKAVEAGIKRVVFDRGGYAYHGRVQAVADGAREGGLEF